MSNGGRLARGRWLVHGVVGVVSLYTNPFFPLLFANNMHSEHAVFLSVGAQVSAAATFFDIPDEPRWSEETYGAEWATARVVGTVFRMARSRVWVRFEDGDERCLGVNELELHGDTLARAENHIRAANGSNKNDAGPSVRFDLGSERATRSPPSDNSEDELPLYALRGPQHTVDGAPSLVVFSSQPESPTQTVNLSRSF